MSFNCSIFLEDIDINCNRPARGGIKKVVLGLQKDLSMTLDPSDETTLTALTMNNSVVFEHNKRDGVTAFNESKANNNGLGVITTNIVIRIPSIDNRMNKIDYMSRRSDIVCVLYHNNGSITVSGWMDGLTMNYNASSGASKNELSFIDVELVTESWIASLAVHNITPVFP